MRSHKALFIGLAVAVALIVTAYVVYATTIRSPQITISVSPAAAEIQIDQQAVHTDKVTLTPGNHTVTITAAGYVPYSKTITLKRGEHFALTGLLKPIPSPTTLAVAVPDGPAFVKDNNIYFLGNNGHTLYKTLNNPDQATLRVQAITPDTLSGIQSVIWRPDAGVVFLKKADGVYLYDFARNDLLHQTSTLWGTNIGNIIWSPDGKTVAYTYYGPNNEQSLILSDTQNKNINRVANLATQNIDHPVMQWSPDGKTILLVSQSAQVKTNYLYSFDIFSAKTTQLSEKGEVAGAIWSPDNAHIAYLAPGTAADGTTQTIIWVANADGSGIKPFNTAVSSIDKLTWSSDGKSLIAVTKAAGQENSLVNINLATAVVVQYQYSLPSPSFVMTHITLSNTNDRIFFCSSGAFDSLSLITPKYES